MATFVAVPNGFKAVIRKSGFPTISKTFRTKRLAMDWARKIEDEMARGVYVDRGKAERTTVAAALERYLKEVTAGKSGGSQAAERVHAATLSESLGKYSLAALTPDIVAKYRDDRLKTISKRWKRRISASTVRLELAMLSHLFETAIREWHIGLVYNPVKSIRKPPAHRGRARRLSFRETLRLCRECRRHSNPMLLWIVKTAMLTAMRKSEIQSLRMRDLDLNRRIARLDQTKNGERRTVPLSTRAVRVLREALENPIRPSETDLVFFGDRNKEGMHNPYSFEPAWQDARRRAGIADFRFHDLRHIATTRLVELGLSDQEVSSITGHKTMQMLRRYTHLRAEDLAKKLR